MSFARRVLPGPAREVEGERTAMSSSNGGSEAQVILITGASSGIGRATAELLAGHGYRVYGTSRNPSAHNVSGYQLLPLEVTSDDSVAECVRAVAERTGGRIDVLVN